jgi:hypothetical protein
MTCAPLTSRLGIGLLLAALLARGAGADTGAIGMTVTWLKCVAAGDYRWLEVSPEGEAEFLRAGPDFRVLEIRRGRLPHTVTDRLRQLLAGAALPTLRSYYPFTSQEDEVVELAYDSVASGTGRLINIVAHERARPPGLKALVEGLGELAAALPAAPKQAARIVALPVENLVCLGEDARKVDLEKAGPPTLQGYLRRAIEEEGRSVSVPPDDVALFAKYIFDGTRLARVRSGDKSYAVLLLAD